MGQFISDCFGKCFPALISKRSFCGLSASDEDITDAASDGENGYLWVIHFVQL